MRKVIFLLITMLLTVSTLSAHIIKGKVYDESGEQLPGATVMIEALQRGEITDQDGRFRFLGIHKGNYTIKVYLVGYKSIEKKIVLTERNEEYIEFHLEPNTELNQVEVFGERHRQPEKLDAITRMPLRPSEQIQSISVISETVIEEQGALTITDAVRNVPGVTLFGSYGGVRESLSTRGYRGVPVLKNGVRVDSDFRTASLASDMQGVESIQVIKGSAAITQGIGNDLGSPGGVINVVTKTPKFVNSGRAALRTGSWGEARATFDVQSVLDKNRTVAFRLNGAYERSDGFKRLTEANRIYINPSLAWKPDDKTTIYLEMDYLDDDKTPDAGTVNLADSDTEALYKDARNKYFGFSTDNINNKTLTYAARMTRYLSDKVYVRAAYFGSSYQTENTSSGLKALEKRDADGKVVKDENGNTVYLHEDPRRNRTLSNSTRDDKNRTLQLDLVGRDINTGSIKHTFQVGFDYRNTDLETANNILTNGDKSGTAVFIDEINVFDARNEINHTQPKVTISKGDPAQSDESNYGLMLQDVTTFNDYLKAIVGLRYSHKSSSENKVPGVVTGSAWNPMAGVMVSPMKNINLFGSFTTTTSLRSAANKMSNGEEIGQSTSSQWEAGVKSDWLNDRLRFNFTYFHILNKNLSNAEYIDGTNQKTNYFIKAGDLQRQGIEVELNGRILNNLQVMLGYAYLDAEYKNSPSYVNGSAPMNAPKHTANGWVQYTLDKTALKGLSIGVGTYYVGARPVNEYSLTPDSHGTPAGVKPFDMPSYVTVNAQLGYTYGHVTARVFFNNIFDEIGYNSYFRGGYINFIDPRNFATTVSYKF